jgi:negative regulator of sigma E activity
MATDVSRTIEEQLSAFLDGELPDEELQLLVRRLERDDEYRATLVRYSMIGSVLRDEPIGASSAKFRSRVMAAIDDVKETDVTVAHAAAGGRSWLKPFASVAVIAVVVTSIVNSGVFESGTGVQPTPEAAGAALVSSAQPAPESMPPGSRQGRQVTRSTEVDRERLRSYMVSHREYARSLQGPMGNSRIFVKQVNFEE